MPKQVFSNNASAVLVVGVDTTMTTLMLDDAAQFPVLTVGDHFMLTLIGLNANGQEASWEMVKCTDRTVNTLTVIRAQENTAGVAWGVGTRAEIRLSAAFANELGTHLANTDNPHVTTKVQVGLGSVDDTPDTDKPVSTAQATANALTLTSAKDYSDTAILPSISKSLHSGAVVKAFLYDTSKDSDGGAWRNRCAHTSWENETLCSGKWIGQKATTALAWSTSGAAVGDFFQNTTDGKFYTLTGTTTASEVFRGNGRKFPAVVNIVAESARVVLYDAATGAMWRVFISSGVSLLHAPSVATLTSVVAMNGLLLIGGTPVTFYGAVVYANFISDTTGRIGKQNGYSNNYSKGGNVASSNGNYVHIVDTSINLVSNAVNDIAITVLDGAPVDPATGLPVPTIYAFTAGGVSRIAHDGTVSSTATGGASANVAAGWIENGVVKALAAGTGLILVSIPVNQILPTGAGTTALWVYWTYSGYYGDSSIPALMAPNGKGAQGVTGGLLGVSALRDNPASPTKGMVANITNAYSSGWMVGDIRGAWLADTVAETIVGSELVTNGTFATGAGWTLGATAPGTAPTITGGVLSFNSATTDYVYARHTLSGLVVGKAYVVKFDITYTSGQFQTYVGAVAIVVGITTSGTKVGYFVATAVSMDMEVSRQIGAGAATFDNVSCKLAEHDRSVKAQGLTVVGSLTKSPVASGASLVAYSGFSAANYLEQPYNANLDFGTGDCLIVKCWVTIDSLANYSEILHRALAGLAGGIAVEVAITTGFVNVYLTATTSYLNVLTSTTGFSVGVRTLLEVGRLAGILYIKMNGVIVGSVANATNITYVNAVTRIGCILNGTQFLRGSLSLMSIGATFPSPDQSAHIYRTELPLFQPDAQCTIDGTSTAVTALAYDDSTELLQVGTSWGRSSFKDLLRVDSEVSTVGAITSISASGGAISTGGATSAYQYQPAMNLRDELKRKAEAKKALGKTPVFFEFDAIAAQTAFLVPKGYTVKAVYSAEALKREGTTKTYTRSYDGFAETINFAVAPGASVWVSIMCVRSN